ncbi:NAD(P)-dependent oxidoreductase [Lysinibacter cavernae]|uniref:NAD(P)-binding domain-containing protein n=1 Tax=Lysinibacter cavernae TaxID=1640652 RepID=A0A7X5TUV2_9MICO|nr:NAD(P)H-binding protein [Lysinibacter cavernae]NIH54833.1 hypothetical protein [Lysinibacter cavernae]
MTNITVLGGTGYAGKHIVAEAARRGHAVTSYSRNAPTEPVAGVTYVTGSLLDPEVLRSAVDGADVVVETLSPRGELDGKLVDLVSELARLATEHGARLGVVGGAGSLLVEPGGSAVADGPDFPAEILSEAKQLQAVLENLRADASGLDWFFVSPAGGFGPWAEGEATGTFRIGGDVLLVDEHGQSNISGADFATAFVDEIESPAHSGARFTVAY